MTPTRAAIKLSELLSAWTSVAAADDVLITGICEYSGDCEVGDLFLAMKSCSYVEQAVSAGAVAIVCDETLSQDVQKLALTVPVVAVAKLAAHSRHMIEYFYKQAEISLPTVAVTGTDGKTSVTHLLAQALTCMGQPCGLIGTLGYGYAEQLRPANHTTPGVAKLAREMQRLAGDGCQAVAIEASSHGIEQGRLANTRVDVAVLTNITRDHLDYHHTLENYIAAKAALFFASGARAAVLNIDDEVGKKWHQQLACKIKVVSYSLSDSDADLYVKKVDYHASGTKLLIHMKGQDYPLELALFGQFNVLNILAVAATLVSLGHADEIIADVLSQLKAVPGRMQFIPNQQMVSIIVDYAHTPAALSCALNAVRQHCQGRLTCVFGCGGNRDQGKRAKMGEVASRYADAVVITSDNPRDEIPQAIIDAIVEGCLADTPCTQIVDRQAAIAHAIQHTQANDTVLIAGKGHEKFQLIGRHKIAFDDAHVAQQVLMEAACG